MGSVLAVLFIGGVAAVGILVGTRPTVADGKVIADTIVKSSKKHELTVACDDRIPIGVDGARFRCSIAADDGSTARIEYTMNRAGAYSADVLSSTGPTHETPRRVLDDADPVDDDDDDGEGDGEGEKRGDPWD
jgi:hypothetical protein